MPVPDLLRMRSPTIARGAWPIGGPAWPHPPALPWRGPAPAIFSYTPSAGGRPAPEGFALAQATNWGIAWFRNRPRKNGRSTSWPGRLRCRWKR